MESSKEISKNLKRALASIFLALGLLSGVELYLNYQDIQIAFDFFTHADAYPLVSSTIIFYAWTSMVVSVLLPLGSIVLGSIGFLNKFNTLWLVISTSFIALVMLLSWWPMQLAGGSRFETTSYFFGYRSHAQNIILPNYLQDSNYVASIVLLFSICLEISLIVVLILKRNLTDKRPAKESSPQVNRLSGDGFIRSMFDFSFDRFIYVKVASLIYLILILIIALTNVLVVLASIYLMMQNFAYILLIPATIIVSFLTLVIIRLSLESGVALVKIAENTRKAK